MKYIIGKGRTMQIEIEQYVKLETQQHYENREI